MLYKRKKVFLKGNQMQKKHLIEFYILYHLIFSHFKDLFSKKNNNFPLKFYKYKKEN